MSVVVIVVLCSDVRDVKCVLELDFVFKIHAISLYEEFMVCTSPTECQAIQLNIISDVCMENSSEEKELTESVQHAELSAGCDTVAGMLPSSAHCHCRFCVYANTDNDVSSTNPSQHRNGETSVDQVVGISCGVGCSVDDDLVNLHSSVGQSTSSPLTHKARLHQEFACSDLGLSGITSECDELFAGPVKGSEAPCSVSVEFEGIMSTAVFLN